MKRNLAIFDLDNTILNGDSDYSWINFLIEQGVVDKEEYVEDLYTQSARIVIKGSYSDIIEFLSTLSNRPQKVCLTDLNMSLSAGESYDPKASFSVTILVDNITGVEQ